MANKIIIPAVYEVNPAGLRKARRELNTFKKQTDQITKGFKMGMGALGAVGLAGSLSSLSGVLGQAVRSSMEFENALSHMSALTGATGRDLDYFKEQALELGSVTQSGAAEVVKAFQLVGGKMPELLKAREGLVAVTQAALTLSEAADTSLEEATNALTMALGQMGAGSDEAMNFINILAAGSKEGAAEIPYLTAAIEKAGGTAKMVGLNFAQLVASIEAVAPRVSQAETAGIGLRNIFIRLEKQTNDGLKPSVVGYNQALENLAASQPTVTELTKLFGMENVAVAQALIEAKDECLRLQGAITGTNTAEEMARTNTDNLKGSVEKLGNAWEGFVLKINRSNGVLKSVVDWVADLLGKMGQMAESVDDIQRRIDANRQKGTLGDVQGGIDRAVAGGTPRKVALKRELARWTQKRAEAQAKINAYNQQYTPAQRRRQTKAYYGQADLAKNGLAPLAGMFVFDNALAGKYAEGLTARQAKGDAERVMEWLRGELEKKPDGGKLEEEEGSLSQYEKEIRRLKEELDLAKRGGGGAQAAAEAPAPEGSLDWYEEEIRRLEERLGRATTDGARQDLSAQIGELTAQKEAIEETLRERAPEGSLDWYAEEIRRLTDELGTATEEATRQDLSAQIGALEREREEMEEALREKTPEGSLQALDDEIRRIAEAISLATEAATRQSLTAQLEALNKQKEQMRREAAYAPGPEGDMQRQLDYRSEVSGNIRRYTEGAQLGGATGAYAKEQLQYWQRVAEQIGLVQDEMNGLMVAQGAMEDVLGLGNAFSQLGEALGVNTDGLRRFMNVLQATVAVMTAAKAVMSIFGFGGGGILGGLVGSFGGFADGGVVGGQSWTGDRVVARLNSGEMVINRQDQRKLFSMIKRGVPAGGGMSPAGGGSAAAQTVVTGEQIVTVINNYAKRRGRGEVIKV